MIRVVTILVMLTCGIAGCGIKGDPLPVAEVEE